MKTKVVVFYGGPYPKTQQIIPARHFLNTTQNIGEPKKRKNEVDVQYGDTWSGNVC